MSKWSLSVLAAHAVVAAVPSIITGREFSFIIEDHVALAVGNNMYGQLGVNPSASESEKTVRELTPVELDGEVKMVAAGAFHSLFLMADGKVYASGRNNIGQLGLSQENMTHMTHLPLPVDIGTSTVTAVAAGYAHSLFLMSDGSVWGVGLNSAGQLGDDTTTSRNTVVQVQLNGSVSAIAAGYDFSYFLMDNGDVFATGQNLGGQLGDGTKKSKCTPSKVVGVADVTSIAAGESHGLFLQDGKVFGTGSNYFGQHGDMTLSSKSHPRIPADLREDVVQIFAGADSSFVIGTPPQPNGQSNILAAFGSNIDGQLGLRGLLYSERYVFWENGLYDFTAVSLGESHSLALLRGQVWATGRNTYGQLANNGTGDVREFMVVYGEKTPSAPTPAPAPPPAPPGRNPNDGGDPLLPIVIVVVSVVFALVGLIICCRAAQETAISQENGDVESNMLPELSGATGAQRPRMSESELSELPQQAPESNAVAPEPESNAMAPEPESNAMAPEPESNAMAPEPESNVPTPAPA